MVTELPLLNPNQLKSGIHNILKESKLTSRTDSGSTNALSNRLEEAGLSSEEVLSQVGSIMRCAEREETRLGAAKIGLQLNGLLNKDEGVSIPVVNIIIQDSQIGDINPILIPR